MSIVWITMQYWQKFVLGYLHKINASKVISLLFKVHLWLMMSKNTIPKIS